MSHLSVEEKLNAENELDDNLDTIKAIRKEKHALLYISKLKYGRMVKDAYSERIAKIEETIDKLNARNKKLRKYLKGSKTSKYNGLYSLNCVCYKEFGKKRCELTIEEARRYNAIMKERLKKKKEKGVDKEIILDLFFEKLYSIERIVEYFEGKYTEREIKSVIDERYK